VSAHGLVRGVIRRAGWTLVDQAVNTATNFALVVFVARSSSAENFGAFAVVYALYAFTVAITQALVGETFLVTTDRASPMWRRTAAAATGAAVIVGLIAALPLVGFALVAESRYDELLLLLALALPALLVQDTTRVVHIASGHPSRAAVNDLAWALLQASAFVALAVADRQDIRLLFLAWAVPGVACAALGCVQLRARPSTVAGLGWMKEHRRLGGSYALESLAYAGSNQLTTLAVATAGGLPAAGALRAGQSIYGPANVPLLMLRLVGIAEARAAIVRGRHELRAMVRYLGAAGTAIGAAVLVAVLLVPDSLGRWLFGETWMLASALLVPLGLQKIAIGYSAGSFAGLRVLQAARLTLMLRTFGALTTFSGGVVGAIVASAEGCAYGLLVGSLAGIIPMRVTLWRLMDADSR
jgi:O-antigen/teichoic acid export membrane protein